MQYKVGDKVVFKRDTDSFIADGVFTVSHTDTNRSTQYIRLEGYDDWFPSDRFLKVPLFNVEQVVKFKDIKQDKWCTSGQMVNLEGKIGIVMEVNRGCYYADKPYQDGCQYKVKDLQKGSLWYVTSASLERVSAMTNTGTVNYYTKEDIIAATTTAERIAQAVDNVKPRFKIGDKVIIRNDLVPGKMYAEWGGWYFLSDMAQHMGKVAKVIDYGYDDPNYLRLDVDNGEKSWIINALLPYTPGSDYDLDKQIINQQKTIKQNENRLQEKGTVIAGRERQSGCAVRYPGEQIRVGISNLGYRKVTCKR